MTQPEEFDLVILGGGTGSTVAAWTFAGEGNRVGGPVHGCKTSLETGPSFADSVRRCAY
jgi:hypothetical protein